MIVLTSPTAGRDAEYNAWYDNRHLPDMVRLCGFSDAQRFRAHVDIRRQPPPHAYAAVYATATSRTDTVSHIWERILFGRRDRAEAEAVGRDPLIPLSSTLAPTQELWFFDELYAPSVDRDAPVGGPIGTHLVLDFGSWPPSEEAAGPGAACHLRAVAIPDGPQCPPLPYLTLRKVAPGDLEAVLADMARNGIEAARVWVYTACADAVGSSRSSHRSMRRQNENSWSERRVQ